MNADEIREAVLAMPERAAVKLGPYRDSARRPVVTFPEDGAPELPDDAQGEWLVPLSALSYRSGGARTLIWDWSVPVASSVVAEELAAVLGGRWRVERVLSRLLAAQDVAAAGGRS